MNRFQVFSDKQEIFINYLIEKTKGKDQAVPSIGEMSQALGWSKACLREQIELAKNLGLIKIQPRKGIEILPYRFTPAVKKSLYYAIKVNRSYFEQFSEIRNHLERSFFKEAALSLTQSDFDELDHLTQSAEKKLLGNPIQIPHSEHRKYHLIIYRELNNTFLNGMLEAYWDTYEMVGLDVYTDLDYLNAVWDYHHKIVEHLKDKQIEDAYELLVDHMQLIYQR